MARQREENEREREREREKDSEGKMRGGKNERRSDKPR